MLSQGINNTIMSEINKSVRLMANSVIKKAMGDKVLMPKNHDAELIIGDDVLGVSGNDVDQNHSLLCVEKRTIRQATYASINMSAKGIESTDNLEGSSNTISEVLGLTVQTAKIHGHIAVFTGYMLYQKENGRITLSGH